MLGSVPGSIRSPKALLRLHFPLIVPQTADQWVRFAYTCKRLDMGRGPENSGGPHNLFGYHIVEWKSWRMPALQVLPSTLTKGAGAEDVTSEVTLRDAAT